MYMDLEEYNFNLMYEQSLIQAQFEQKIEPPENTGEKGRAVLIVLPFARGIELLSTYIKGRVKVLFSCLPGRKGSAAGKRAAAPNAQGIEAEIPQAPPWQG
jgi:hypothetical protein